MPYNEPFSRARPGCMLFLIDQSFSMEDPIGGQNVAKSVVVMRVVNQCLAELIYMCTFRDPKPRHYLDVGVIGYTSNEQDQPSIQPAFQGNLKGRQLVSIPELYDNVFDTDELGSIDKKHPVWIPAVAIAGTPMASALRYCVDIVEHRCATHPESYPPIVIHITDGELAQHDEDPLPAAAQLRALATRDGQVLLYNFHLSATAGRSIMFPVSESELEQDSSKLLFRMSSELPESARRIGAAKLSRDIPSAARGMAFNTQHATDLLKLVQTGTPNVKPQKPPGDTTVKSRR